MITEEMLRRAAVISSDAFVRSLEDYDREEHVFSPKFEKKIRKLYRRANHPYLYRAVKKVASFLLALLIGGGIWLTVDEEARAAFFGWIKEVYESAVAWYSSGDSDGPVERKDYYIPVLPEGYKEVYVKNSVDGKHVVYQNDCRQYLKFHYVWGDEFSGLLGGDGDTGIYPAIVHGRPADIVLSDSPNLSNAIGWKTEDAMLVISGFLSPEELVALAESVERMS